jgi:hypothetical protein
MEILDAAVPFEVGLMPDLTRVRGFALENADFEIF